MILKGRALTLALKEEGLNLGIVTFSAELPSLS